MTNIRLLLFLGTSVFFSSSLVFAQCVASQDCETLGYTEIFCNGDKGVKCPFGNKWFCFESEESICNKNGFTKSCTGVGQLGVGGSCGGLYVECSCVDGYEWKNEICQPRVTDGVHGDLFYCDGDVVAVKIPEINFYVSIKNLGRLNWALANSWSKSHFSCTEKGRLPTVDELRFLYKYKSSINNLLSEYNGDAFENFAYWTSSEFGSAGTHYYVDMSDGQNNRFSTGNDSLLYVHPVLIP